MNCKTACSLISDYLDDQLADSQKQSFEAHIACCQACACKVSETREILVSLSLLAIEKSPVDCWEQVRNSIVTIPKNRRRWFQGALNPIFAAPAAVVAALVLALFLLWPAQSTPPASDKSMASEYAYYIGVHQRAHVPLRFADQDAAFVKAEIQKAGLIAASK
ncbi:MAG: anti-sigma factor family protein [Armatimonadota bacterium]